MPDKVGADKWLSYDLQTKLTSLDPSVTIIDCSEAWVSMKSAPGDSDREASSCENLCDELARAELEERGQSAAQPEEDPDDPFAEVKQMIRDSETLTGAIMRGVEGEQARAPIVQPIACDGSDADWDESDTKVAFPMLAAVSTKIAAEIDTFALERTIDEHASSLLKQLSDAQAIDIMARAFQPRVRNPSAYITRASKAKLREQALGSWPSGGDDKEWWGDIENRDEATEKEEDKTEEDAEKENKDEAQDDAEEKEEDKAEAQEEATQEDRWTDGAGDDQVHADDWG